MSCYRTRCGTRSDRGVASVPAGSATEARQQLSESHGEHQRCPSPYWVQRTPALTRRPNHGGHPRNQGTKALDHQQGKHDYEAPPPEGSHLAPGNLSHPPPRGQVTAGPSTRTTRQPSPNSQAQTSSATFVAKILPVQTAQRQAGAPPADLSDDTLRLTPLHLSGGNQPGDGLPCA